MNARLLVIFRQACNLEKFYIFCKKYASAVTNINEMIEPMDVRSDDNLEHLIKRKGYSNECAK